MAKPASVFEWASNTLYATGVGNGTPTKVNPATVDHENGFMPLTAAVPQHMNWLIDQLHSWVTYLDGLATDAQFLANTLHFTAGLTLDGLLTANRVAIGNGASTLAGNLTVDFTKDVKYSGFRQYKKMIPLTAGQLYGDANTFGPITAGGVDLFQTGHANATSISFHLDLPVGAQLQSVRAGVHSSSIAPSSGSRVNIDVSRVTYDTVSPTAANTVGASAVDTANAVNVFDILEPVFSATVNATSTIIVSITSSKDSTFADPDTLLWLEVVYAHANFDSYDHV